MKRTLVFTSLMAVTVSLYVLRADVKTTEKTTAKLGGMLGSMSRLVNHGPADGVSSTVAVKGNRKLSMNDTTGEIVDLAEEKVYRLDIKKKEYKILTFDQIRKEWEDTKAEADKNAEKMKEAQGDDPDANRKLVFTATVKPTGQQKSMAGYDAREIVITITGVEEGKTLEQGGGMVLTNTVWLGPKIAAVDEIAAFDLKYFKAIMGTDDAAAMMQQLTTLFAMFGNAKPAMDQMMAESRKLQGTPLASTLVIETVKSADAASGGSSDQSSASRGVGGLGGSLSGALTRHITSRGGAGDASPRSTLLTSTHEIQTITTTVAAGDVAVPTGFKEKK